MLSLPLYLVLWCGHLAVHGSFVTLSRHEAVKIFCQPSLYVACLRKQCVIIVVISRVTLCNSFIDNCLYIVTSDID